MNGDEPTSDQDFVPSDPPEAPEDVPAPTLIPGQRPVRARRLPPAADLPEASSLQGQVYALTGAQQTMFQRLDQSLKLQDQSYQQLQGLMQQMQDTLKLWQESFNQVDQMADKLARIGAALVKLYSLEIESQNESLF